MNFSRVVVKMSGRDVAQRKDNKCSTDKRSKMSPDKKKKKVKKKKKNSPIEKGEKCSAD